MLAGQSWLELTMVAGQSSNVGDTVNVILTKIGWTIQIFMVILEIDAEWAMVALDHFTVLGHP